MLTLVCGEAKQLCCNIAPFLKIVKLIITILQFSVPAVLIILGSIDMFKAITAHDDKESTDVTKKFGKRLAFAVIIFLVPFLVKTILELVENSISITDDEDLPGFLSWVSCWNNADNSKYCSSCDDIYDASRPNEGGNGSSTSSGEKETSADKTCYVWQSASCENEGIANFSFPGVSSITTPKYDSQNNYCHITINMTGTGYANYDNCINICPYLDSFFEGNNENKKTCSCSYNGKISSKSSSELPKKALEGKVDVYSCPKTTSCDAYDFVIGGACEGPIETKTVNKE